MSDTEPLRMWVVYFDPDDFPGLYVVRLFLVYPSDPQPTATHYVADTLEAVRDFIPVGLVKLQRHPNDDPVIVESWI